MHGGSGTQDVGGLSHELGGLDFGASGNDLALSDPLALGSHGERVLELGGEDDVLDEHAFDLDTPAHGDVLDDLTDGGGDFLAALNDVLKDTRAENVTEGGLCALDECLADVGNAERGLVWAGDVVVNHRGELQVDVIFGHADLLGHLDDLDLDVDLDEFFRERVDLDQTGVDGAIEATKLGDQADISLRHWFVGVGANNTAGNCAAETDHCTQRIDCEL